MRRSSLSLILSLFSVLFLASCLTDRQAPAPVTMYGREQGPGSSGVHNVTRGDTLWSISNRYNISMQDIVVANNLSAPFALHVGQRITLPPPMEYRARAGDTLYSVSRLFNVGTGEIVRQNNLTPPYTLHAGQVLNMPSVTRAPPEPMSAAQIIAQNQPSVPVVIETFPDAKVEREELAPPAPQNAAGQNQSDIPAGNQGMDDSAQKDSAPPVTTTEETPPPEKPLQPVKTGTKTKLSAIKTKAPPRAKGGFARPLEGKVISSYGTQGSGLHNDGINIAAARGAPVKAADNGVVVYAGNELKGSGNLVLLRHDGGWMTAYAHMDKINVSRGQILNQGQVLGQVGATGSVSSPQLHFELRKGTSAVNPVKYFGK